MQLLLIWVVPPPDSGAGTTQVVVASASTARISRSVRSWWPRTQCVGDRAALVSRPSRIAFLAATRRMVEIDERSRTAVVNELGVSVLSVETQVEQL